MNLSWTLILVLLVLILIYAFSSCQLDCDSKENFYYNPAEKSDYCEKQYSCLYNGRRTCTLSNGTEGVCVLNGLCCPTFMDYTESTCSEARGTRTSNCVQYYNNY